MVERFRDKVVVVAGAGSGIGAATARRLAQEGARVLVGDIASTNAGQVAAEIRDAGGEATPVHYDQSEEGSIAQLIASATDAYGGLDALHANAADLRVVLSDTDAADVGMDVFHRTIEVNLQGYLLLTRYAVPAMLKRGGGSIVYTSSAAAFIGESERPSYAMSKAGANALMRHVASKWGREGIRANAVAPGLVMTPGTRDNLPPEFRDASLALQRSPRFGEPEDIAAAVTFLLSGDADWITGQVLSVDGGTLLR